MISFPHGSYSPNNKEKQKLSVFSFPTTPRAHFYGVPPKCPHSTHSHNTLSFPCTHSYLHAPSPHIHSPSLHTLLVPLTSCYRYRRKRRAQDTQWGHCAPGGAFGGRSSGLINRTKEGHLFPWSSLIFLPGLGAGVNSRPWGSSNLGGLKVMKETGWGQSKKATGAVLQGKGGPESRGYSPALPGRAVPVWTRLELKAHANKEESAFCLRWTLNTLLEVAAATVLAGRAPVLISQHDIPRFLVLILSPCKIYTGASKVDFSNPSFKQKTHCLQILYDCLHKTDQAHLHNGRRTSSVYQGKRTTTVPSLI